MSSCLPCAACSCRGKGACVDIGGFLGFLPCSVPNCTCRLYPGPTEDEGKSTDLSGL